jgi:hypothetical protein
MLRRRAIVPITIVGFLAMVGAGDAEPLPPCPAPFLGLDLVEGGPFWPLTIAERLARELPGSAYERALAGDPPRSETFVFDGSRGTVFDLVPDRVLEERQLAVRCSPLSTTYLFEIGRLL